MGRKKIDDGFKTPQARYDAQNTTRVSIKLSNNTDADILQYLAKTPNNQGLLKKLIREHIANSTANTEQ